MYKYTKTAELTTPGFSGGTFEVKPAFTTVLFNTWRQLANAPTGALQRDCGFPKPRITP